MTKTIMTIVALCLAMMTKAQPAKTDSEEFQAEIDSIISALVDDDDSAPVVRHTQQDEDEEDWGYDVDYDNAFRASGAMDLPEPSETKTMVKVDSRPQRILLFGDSMLDGVGRRFQDYADQNGHSLFTSIWYGSTVHQWARTTELDRLMDKVKPTFVIISLGTNDLGFHDLQARSESVKEILRVVGDIPYVWIGPAKLPKLNKDFGIVDMLRNTIGEENFYDSYYERLARLSDNVHPTFPASAVWVDKVVDWMNRPDAPHIIKMSRPEHNSKFRNFETHRTSYKGKSKNGLPLIR